MSEFTLEEVPQYEAIPDGTIAPATVDSVELGVAPWKDDNGGEIHQVSFKFTITDGEHAGRKVWGRTPKTFTTHDNCKLRLWVQELLGQRSLPSGFKFSTEALEGLSCRVAVTAYEGKDGKLKNYVGDVLSSAEVDIDPF